MARTRKGGGRGGSPDPEQVEMGGLAGSGPVAPAPAAGAAGGEPVLVVFDLLNLVFRAYFALPKLTSSCGEPTGAVLGVLRMVRKVIRERGPDAVAVAVESAAPMVRKRMFGGYKATRPQAPADLKSQVPVIMGLLARLGLRSFSVDGWEADDVIATLARKGRSGGYRVLIVSGDKDLMQLVGDGVRLIVEDPGVKASREMDEEAVRGKWGVPPSLMVDLLSLMGDSSDNVPGVPGVGQKTAARLLGEHGSLDGVLEAAACMKPGRLRDGLTDHRDSALLSRSLVVLRDDLPIDVDLRSLALGPPPDVAGLTEELSRLELRDLASEILGTAGATARPVAAAGDGRDYGLILTLDDLEVELRRARDAGAVSVDLETTSVVSTRAEIVGLSLSSAAGRGRYLAIAHAYPGAPAQPPLEKVLAAVRPILEDPGVAKYGQHVKYEDVIFSRHGIRMRGVAFDTMLASYLLDPERHQHRLEQIAAERLGYRMTTYDEVTRKQRGSQLRFDEVPVDEAARYSAEDAEVVFSLVPGMRGDLDEAGLASLLADVELPLSRVLADMERTGIPLDTAYLAGLERRFEVQLAGIEERAHASAGRPFNLASPVQLQKVLFEDLGLEPVRKTKTGFSTDSDVLAELGILHELPGLVLEHRALSKLIGTYVRALPQAVDPATGRVHTSYNQAVAATGRLSSSDPNLQNIPVRSENGRLIRAAFKPSPGRTLMSADYSQIELRILAQLSRDEALIAAFESGMDVHSRTASQIFGVPLEEVTHDLRARAKAINFGVIYGQSDFGLSQQLGIPRKEARDFIERYFAEFVGVRSFMGRVVEEARETGMVKTLLGRRRYVRAIASRNHAERSNAERMAQNTPIQGTAADMIKVAMIRIHGDLAAAGLASRLILTVHDEVVLDVAPEERSEVERLVRRGMESALALSVPVVVDVGWGEDWGEAHP